MNTPTAWEGFFIAFWPNLAATFLGAALGIPAGLYLLHVGQGIASRASRREDERRLGEALHAVQGAIGENEAVLSAAVEGFNKPSFDCLNLALDVVTWEACKGEIIPRLGQPTLQRDLAQYFGHLADAVRLNTLYLTHVTGSGAALVRSNDIRKTLSNGLLHLVTVAREDGRKLHQRLAARLLTMSKH